MMDYRLITRLAGEQEQRHLITFPGSRLLNEPAIARQPLIADMTARADRGELADAQFGCAPFARLTLAPRRAWREPVEETLLNLLRPLFAASACPQVVLDCTDIDETVLAKTLRYLFNLDWRLTDLGLKASLPSTPRLLQVVGYCRAADRPTLETLFRQQQAATQGMIVARRLADLPADRCTPQWMAEEAQRLCAGRPRLRCETLDDKAIGEQGLGLLQAVGQGAARPPRLLALHYDGGEELPTRCYVGKGITFDTGGLWLKEGAGMSTMKYDMCGAANVLGLMLSIDALALPVRAMGVLALAENAIGPAAVQPGSVARACNGITVEINNTDAEGRLVLADAIAWAARRHPQARYIIDVATLTGAVVKALGYDLSGLMTENAALRDGLTAAGRRCGDEVWSLPLDARLRKQSESAIADLCNTPGNNAAISASAGWLLRHFSPPDIPWAHLDVSGTALWRENGRSVASGRPIPLLLQHLLDDLRAGS